MKKNIEATLWLFAAICFFISSILSINYVYLTLSFAFACLGFVNLRKSNKKQ